MIKITPVDGLFRVEMVRPRPVVQDTPALIELADDLAVYTLDAAQVLHLLKSELLPAWHMVLEPPK